MSSHCPHLSHCPLRYVKKCGSVLLDMNFTSGINTGNEGLFWLHEIKKIHPSLPVVLFTAYADIDLAVRGIKEGATDFIVKPWNNARLKTLLSACRNSCTETKKKRAEIPKTVSSMYWGESNAMQQLRTLIEKGGPNRCQYSDYR